MNADALFPPMLDDAAAAREASPSLQEGAELPPMYFPAPSSAATSQQQQRHNMAGRGGKIRGRLAGLGRARGSTSAQEDITIHTRTLTTTPHTTNTSTPALGNYESNLHKRSSREQGAWYDGVRAKERAKEGRQRKEAGGVARAPRRASQVAQDMFLAQKIQNARAGASSKQDR